MADYTCCGLVEFQGLMAERSPGRAIKVSAPTASPDCWLRLSVKLHLGITEEDEVRWRDRDRTVDAEYRDLELVAGLDGFGEHDAVRHVEALDGGWTGIAAAPRHLAVDPHLRIIVHIGREHRLGCGGVEVADLGRDGQGCAIPQEGRLAAAAPVSEALGFDDLPFRIIEVRFARM